MGGRRSGGERLVCASCGLPVQDRQHRRRKALGGGRWVPVFFCGPACVDVWEAGEAEGGPQGVPPDDSIIRAAAGLGEPELDRAFRLIAGYLTDAVRDLPDVDARDRVGFLTTSIRSVAYGEAHNILYSYGNAAPAVETARRVFARGRPTPVAREHLDLADALIVAGEAVLDQTCPGWREGRFGPRREAGR